MRQFCSIFCGCALAARFLHVASILDMYDIHDEPQSHPETIRNVAVFYNVYTNLSINSAAKEIVKEQMAQMRPEHKVFIRSIGDIVDGIGNATIVRHDEVGNETETLALLWEYCKEHSGENVIYIHNKGSFHPTPENDALRKFMTYGALSRQCSAENMASMSSCNVCSSRMSPLPHPHTSGNMWTATCAYVQKLINPLEFRARMASFYGGHDKENACVGMGRFSAEHCIHSHHTVHPCHLYTEDGFTWNYDGIPQQETGNDDYGGKMILAPAPRFNFTTYKKVDICPGAKPNLSHLEGRLKEYQGLYGGKPAESWWGWKFYDIPKEEGEWKRKLSKAELRMLRQERKRKKKKERRKREEKDN